MSGDMASPGTAERNVSIAEERNCEADGCERAVEA